MIIYVCGEEEFLVERKVLEFAQENLLTGTRRYSYPDDWEKFILESQSSWDYDRVLHVIELSAGKLGDKIPESVPFVAVIGKTKASSGSIENVFAYPQLRTFTDNNDVVKWIVEEGRRFNIDLRKVANPLFLNCGSGLRKLHSEIDKISQLVPPGGEVNSDVLRLSLSFAAEFTPQPIVDAIVSRQPARAVSFLQKLQENKDETGWVLAYLIRTVYQQIQLELLPGRSSAEVANILGVHPFVFSKVWENRRGIWTLDFLYAAHTRLLDLDSYHKTGGKFSHPRLEKEVLELASPTSPELAKRN